MNPKSRSDAAGNARRFRSISYVLVFLMMICAAITIGNLIQNVLPGWHAGMIVGVMLLIVIDRLYTYQQLKSLTLFSSEWAIYLGTQWVVIVLFIRLLLSYANGLDSFLTDLSRFVRGDIEHLLTPEFLVTLLLALLVWYLVAQFLELLDEMGLDQELALHEESAPIQINVIPPHRRLVNLSFSMGIALVMLTALTSIDLHTTFSTGIPRVEWNRLSGGEAGALLYFVFGLALLSLGRLISLQTHWNRQRIPVSSNNLARQWGMYSLFFLLILAIVVSVLPAGDSLGFFSLLGTLLAFLIGVLIFIAQLIMIFVALVFSIPFLLFGKVSPFMNNLPVPSLLPNLPVAPASPSASNAAWMLIRSILLWGSLLVILVFSFIRFVRQHDSILAAFRKSRITNWLLLAWRWLYRNVEKTRGNLSRALADGWQSLVARLEGKRILPRPGWISLRSLDPRQRIFFFYLAMIRRGHEQGLRRKPAQTPSEYAVTLEKAVPTAGEDIDSVTDAFVEARYSRHEVNSTEADLVKAAWARIRRALQSKSDSG